MKYSFYLMAILLLPLPSYADDLDDQINKACLRHAVSLVARLKTEVLGELNQTKSDQALKLATESCQAYFSKEFSSTTITTNSEEKVTVDKEKSGDSFTDRWMESADKDGNKRLKRK